MKRYQNHSNYGNYLYLTGEEAASGYHQGSCDKDIEILMEKPEIKEQLDSIDTENLMKELSEYGSWDKEELKSHKDNLSRWLWISCGDVTDQIYMEE